MLMRATPRAIEGSEVWFILARLSQPEAARASVDKASVDKDAPHGGGRLGDRGETRSCCSNLGVTYP
jgi:hypothetical protein